MADSESRVRLSVKMKRPAAHTASWAKILVDGRIELEYFDFSEEAHDTFGNDVAYMYHVELADKPRLVELLEERTRSAISGDQAVLDAFADEFPDVWSIKNWLAEKQVPFTKEFDSWA
jgi:hypothetical protein